MDSINAPTAGQNIAVLRKARGLTQTQLARRAGLSPSYLSKLEEATRPVTPPVQAAVAKALGVAVNRITGQPYPAPLEQSDRLDALRGAVRRYRLPRLDVPSRETLERDLKKAAKLRQEVRYGELLTMLPALLDHATSTALAAGGDAVAWGQVADAYGCAYSVAHRLGETDLAENIVSRQQWAAQRTWNPEAEAAAAWNEAGVYQSAGEFDDGLSVVDSAIIQLESLRTRTGSSGPGYLVSLGSLHLRGVVLASRAKDKHATEEHSVRAGRAAAELGDGPDVVRHNLTFGHGNKALYDLASYVELGKPDRAAAKADELFESPPQGLGPNRISRLYIDTARARLEIKDHSGAEQALKAAFDLAPEMTRVHPMARDVLRVLMVLHQRSRPNLMSMAKRSGLAG